MKNYTLTAFIFCISLTALCEKKPTVETGFPGCVPLKGEMIHSFCGKDSKPMFPIHYLYMSTTEISNIDYREFVHDLRKQGGDWKAVLPDTTLWMGQQYYAEPYVMHYYQHPAYSYYPVVNVSKNQAEAYCTWLTEILNKRLVNSKGKTPFEKVLVRLPNKEEWEFAARSRENDPAIIYPWKTASLRVEEAGKRKGTFQANFKRGRGDMMGVAGGLNDNADYTAPVNWYLPNQMGFYNLSGNVSEMVQDEGIIKGGSWNDGGYDLQIGIDGVYQGPSPEIGFRYVVEVISVNQAYYFNKNKKLDWDHFVADNKYWNSQIAFIPSGTLYKSRMPNGEKKDYMPKIISENNEYKISAFKMWRTEVSNFQYQLFLLSLSKADQKRFAPKSKQWSEISNYKWFETYHENPLYANHPVVNVSRDAVDAFCDWLTKVYNENENRIYKKVKFRLPTVNEWEYAARGGKKMSPYPWGGPFLQNSKGCYLTNFNPLEERYKTFSKDQELKLEYPEDDYFISARLDGVKYLAKINAYWPNDFGLYNMSGNAAEMVSFKNVTKGGSFTSLPAAVSILASEGFKSYSPMVGFRPVMEIVERFEEKNASK